MNQHRAVSAVEVEPIAADRRPALGPIAVSPDPDGEYSDAVEAGGGTVTTLGDDTRGLVWLDHRGVDALADVLHAHPGISWVQLPVAGIDSFADLAARHPAILWTSAKGAYAQPVAEHALTLTLALLRQLPQRILATSWDPIKSGTSLYGLEVTIVGAGGIAVELLRLLAPFGVRTTVVRRSRAPLPGADRTVSAEHLLDVLPDADVVVLAAASTADTRQLIGETELRAMKDTAVLVNIARGALVDTDALAGALASRTIGGAGLDVTDPEPLPHGHPLWLEPLAIITPHVADTPEMIEPLLRERISANVAAYLGDGRFVGVVDAAKGY